MMEPDKSELQFQWGKKRGVGGAKKDTQFYESFTFDGEEYSLYDCVYLFKEGEDEPYIGKLLKVWDQDNRRKVKILWFFRPTDITNYLGDYVPMDKEIFLASGEGVGLFNINILESIGGKCSVICTSKDKRNPQPSKEAIESADYIFCCTFDVGTCTISDKISDKIAGVEVKFLLNQEEHDPSPISKAEACGLDGNGNFESGEYKAHADIPGDKPSKKIRPSSDTLKSSDDLEKNKNATDMKKVHIMHDEDGSGKGSVRPMKESSGKMKLSERNSKSLEADVNDGKPLKKMKLSSDLGKLSADLEKNKNAVSTRKVPILSHDDSGKGSVRSIKESSGMMKLNEKNTKSLDESRMKDAAVSVKINETSERQVLDVTRRPDTDRSKWFKGLPWEGRMKKANEQGTLVFLDNIDRSVTSTDLEDIMYGAFAQSCTAKIIPQLPVLSPLCGQAYVIFKTPDAADEAVEKINKGCLMQSNGRPFIASKGMLPVAPKATFQGHLSFERRFQMQREEMRKAVSTSHCSQPNTIEYEMAMEWILLQEKYGDCYSWLYKRQAGDVKQIKNIVKAKL